MTDLSSFYDFTHALEEAESAFSEFKVIHTTMDILIKTEVPLSEENMLQQVERFFDSVKRAVVLFRRDEQGTEIQYEQAGVYKNGNHDRVFPLETLEIQKFNAGHEYDIENAVIHIGPYADDFARSLNALALTVGNDIYFRSNAYNTGTEEGKKTLAHELTHVAQYKENRIIDIENRNQIEAEARGAETKEAYEDDPYLGFKYQQGKFRVKKSKLNQFAEGLADSIEAEIYRQKYVMEGADYFKLLLEYKAWLREGTGYGIFGV